jgi:hypothetical protein
MSSVWISMGRTANGLAVVQEVANEERDIGVGTRISHASGQWMEFGPLVVPMAKQDAHGVGSAIYGKRYGLCAALGIVARETGQTAAAAHLMSQRFEY